MERFEVYEGTITIGEWIEQHPQYDYDDQVCEGYGDGWIDIELMLDEDHFEVFINEDLLSAEFSV